MDLHQINTFAAPREAVLAMLKDPVFLADVCRATGALDCSVEASTDLSRIRRRYPTPSSVKRFVGDTMPIVEEIRWDATGKGAHRLEVEGVPVTYTGTITLTETIDTTMVAYAGTLKVAIPFVGASLEASAAPVITEALAVQEHLGTGYLTMD